MRDRCCECRGTGYAEAAPGFSFGNDCPVCKGEGWLDPEEIGGECSTCRGTGVINPLTAPDGFLCFSSTTCPHCEGTGRDV